MKVYRRSTAAIALLAVSATGVFAEEVSFKGKVSDLFGDRVVVQTADQTKYLVNIGPKAKEVGALKAGDDVTVEGDLKKSGEVRPHKLTLADGKVVAVPKDRKSWRNWFFGDEGKSKKQLTAADARKIAADKGYVVSSEPVSVKKHYEMTATKDGKTYDLHVHRNGDVKENVAFLADDAKKVIAAEGYEVIGQPLRVGKHYEALARKNSVYYEVHAHADGKVKEARKLDKNDARWGAQIPGVL